MREIKFRAWDSEFKQFSFFSFEGFPKKVVTPYWTKSFPVRRGKIGELQQFTGLYSKNKKEIYEGDIIEYKDKSGISDSGIKVVGWDENAAGFGLEDISGVYDMPFEVPYQNEFVGEYSATCAGQVMGLSKVIGNIYENKDLLK